MFARRLSEEAGSRWSTHGPRLVPRMSVVRYQMLMFYQLIVVISMYLDELAAILGLVYILIVFRGKPNYPTQIRTVRLVKHVNYKRRHI